MNFITEPPLKQLAKLNYQSTSHTFNKAVIAAYANVEKYGFTFDYNAHGAGNLIVEQRQRRLVFHLYAADNLDLPISRKKTLIFTEFERPKTTKVKEVCYNLDDLFQNPSKEIKRGIRFAERPQVKIIDYDVPDSTLSQIYNGWNETKLSDGKLFRISFNPRRYYRSYGLKKFGFNIYQKLIVVNNLPYGLINFSLDSNRAFELSFLSLFKDKARRVVNDQNECIIIHCLKDLYDNYGIKSVNLGTAASIKGLAAFKKQFPFIEQIVYSSEF